MFIFRLDSVFVKKKTCWSWIDWAKMEESASYLSVFFTVWKMPEVDSIFLKLRVSIKDSYNKPCGKFYRMLFAISYKFPDLIFAPHVSCISQIESLGYLCRL